MKRKTLIHCPGLLACLLGITLFLTACKNTPADTGNSSRPASSGVSSANMEEMDFTYTDRDRDSSYSQETATSITMMDTTVTIEGAGAAVNNENIITITDEGTYILTGSLQNGRILIDAEDTDKIQLVLDGVSLTCSQNAPLFIRSADKVFITLAPESQNFLEDGASYSLSDDDNNVDGAIFSRADLTFNGSGTLTITAHYNHGIVSKDDLIITGGSYTISAAGDGLQGKDCVKIADGALTVVAGSDGIKSNGDESDTKGFVSIDGGTISITAETDGIQAETILRITNADIQITAGGGSSNASTDKNGRTQPGWGNWERPDSNSQTTAAETASAKGLKAGSAIYLQDGIYKIDTSDDTIHANGDVDISGGSYTLSSGDDGIHADNRVMISGGDITISKSYEGIEGTNILISGGTISITASDDGINGAGGNDGSSVNGRPGQNTFSGGNCSLEISGGFIQVNAAGDGLDVNGSLYIKGGIVLVTGPTDNGNGALDYDSVAEISGGVVICTGSSGMAQGFSASSSQNSLMYGFSASQSGDKRISLIDDDGNIVASFIPGKAYTNFIVSAPSMQLQKTYIVAVGGHDDKAEGTGVFSFMETGSLSDAESSEPVTLTSVTTTGGVTGGMGAGPGGGGFPGGNVPGGDRPGGMRR